MVGEETNHYPEPYEHFPNGAVRLMALVMKNTKNAL